MKSLFNLFALPEKRLIKKNYLTSFVITAVVAISLFSCGDKKAGDTMVAPQGMHVLNLNRYGKPFAIFVPDTNAAKLYVTEQTTGALEIKVGKNYAVSINEQAADLELRKTDIKEDEVNKLKSFIVEDATSLMWESAIVNPEFHFVLNKKIGNSEYSFEDVVNPESNPFGKEAIQKMFDSCKNIEEIKK